MLNRGGFLVRCSTLLGKSKNPFETLGLPPTASKAQIKTAYRQLAKEFHPDATGGDSNKMEEVNQAYKWLMKDGGFEQLQKGNRPQGGKSKRVVHPFSQEVEDDAPASRTMTEEEMEKYSALDPSTERRTPSGTFLYQNRDDQSWVEMDRPLIRADQPRYASFSAHADVMGELRRRQMAQEKENNEKSAFQRNVDKLAGSADLPTRNPQFLYAYIALLFVLLYMMIVRTFARQTHQKRRNVFYADVEGKREELLKIYGAKRHAIEQNAVAAALIFLAAAKKKTNDLAPVESHPVLVYDAVRPPASHFHVISGG